MYVEDHYNPVSINLKNNSMYKMKYITLSLLNQDKYFSYYEYHNFCLNAFDWSLATLITFLAIICTRTFFNIISFGKLLLLLSYLTVCRTEIMSGEYFLGNTESTPSYLPSLLVF